MWVKDKIISHWKNFGKSKTFVYRDYNTKTITIDFTNGGSCTKYNYNGKWIAG